MGSLRIDVLDVDREFIGETPEILIFNQRLASDRHRSARTRATKTIVIPNLRDATDNLYRVMIDAPSYLPVQRFVNVTPGKQITVVLPVDRDQVSSVQFPEYGDISPPCRTLLERSAAVEGFGRASGKALWAKLADEQKAGFLNISAKCARTTVEPGRAVLDDLLELKIVRQDRFFVRVPDDMPGRVDAADDIFQDAPGLLHKLEGYQPAGSWKTCDAHANLQLTFFTNGTDTVADVDIDDHNGFAHVFQLVNNKVHGATHPYNIQQLLKFHQEIDPGYSFVLSA